LFSLSCWAGIAATASHFLRAPTMFAWDLSVCCRMFRLEAKSP
jgi:hypothetical protein